MNIETLKSCFVIKAVDTQKHDFNHQRIRHRIVSGMKIIFGPDGAPLSNMNEFTVGKADKARRAGKSWLNTQNAYADDLYQFATFMLVRDLREEEVLVDDLEEFSVCLNEAISVKTNKKLRPATVKRRLATVARYFRFRITKGLPTQIPLDQITALLKDGLKQSHAGSKGNIYLLTPGNTPPNEKISPFFGLELAKVLDKLGPPANRTDGRSRRDRLASEVSYATGMRLDEVCSLTVPQILELARHVDKDDPYKSVGLWLSKTKGLKPGEVFLPSILIEHLLAYIWGERSEVVAEAERLAPGQHRDRGRLFLNGLGSNHRDLGRPLQPDTLSRRFSAAVYDAGLVMRDESFVLDEHGFPVTLPDGTYAMTVRLINCHSFHDLRHTFAVETYYAGVAVGETEPWKKVQSRLRHSSLKTTTDIYLKWVEKREEVISDAHVAALRSVYGLTR